jgi:hypothetical protein
MAIPVGTVHTAEREGGTLKAVCCERCGQKYWYELRRTGTGKGSAALFIGQGAAGDRAAAAAARDLERKLEAETELVPCPACRWVNEDLVRRYRRTLYRRAPLLIVACLVVGLFGGPVIIGATSGVVSPNAVWLTVLTAGLLLVGLTSPLWVLASRAWLRSRVDPNRYHPQPPSLPPGTPPALVERRDPRTGRTELVPAGP